MLQGDKSIFSKLIIQNDCKGHQRSNLQWHYIKKNVIRSTINVESLISFHK